MPAVDGALIVHENSVAPAPIQVQLTYGVSGEPACANDIQSSDPPKPFASVTVSLAPAPIGVALIVKHRRRIDRERRRRTDAAARRRVEYADRSRSGGGQISRRNRRDERVRVDERRRTILPVPADDGEGVEAAAGDRQRRGRIRAPARRRDRREHAAPGSSPAPARRARRKCSRAGRSRCRRRACR